MITKTFYNKDLKALLEETNKFMAGSTEPWYPQGQGNDYHVINYVEKADLFVMILRKEMSGMAGSVSY